MLKPTVSLTPYLYGMDATQLKQLEDRLWKAADQLRANSKLTATEYSFPVLGLIFLRHAYNRFRQIEAEILPTLPVHPQRGRRVLKAEDFQGRNALFLPAEAQWEYLADMPEGEDIGARLDQAMRLIEESHPALADVLPRNYSHFEKGLLTRLIRIFNNEALDGVSGDVFGRIYEYFLNKFAMSGAQEGGEFFTPPSLVNTIVHIIEPERGIVFDPACGSAGMFVQTGHFIEEKGDDPGKRVTFYGQEKTDTNTRLARMNMAVHGLEARILQGNTFYEDHHHLAGRCDYVMANPPFNVDGVDKDRESVVNDPRLPFGLPRNDNANYLWIQYFYSYLNPEGRAGFVMASSASDAGHSEKEIRRQLVETGAVDVMVAIGPKFFYTRSLPCTLWFFDRAREEDPEWADVTLMLDLREVYRKVSTNLHDFTEEQHRNIQALVGLYRGVPDYYHAALQHYTAERQSAEQMAQSLLKEMRGHERLQLPDTALEPAHYKEFRRQISQAVQAGVQLIKDEIRAADRQGSALLKEELGLLQDQQDLLLGHLDDAIRYDKAHRWLQERFPDGVYRDVPGLCRMVTRAEIAAQDYSLTPGRYVGVAPAQEDVDFDFEERMKGIKEELMRLSAEGQELAVTIHHEFQALGL